VTSRTRVFLLAGNRLLCEALGRILQKRPDMAVSGQSFDSLDVAGPIIESETNVLLMDPVATPALICGFVSSIRRSNPDLQVVMIGMDENESTFLNAVQAGAAGYLLRDASAADVINAIRTVSQGEAVCPPRLCRFLFNKVAQEESFAPNLRVNADLGLTRREQELVPMIARGLTNKEIAAHLNLAEQTIKNHVHRMLRKVGADGRMQVPEIARPIS
jgi:DNA-binding NarL/FixJ family response regulator